MDDYGIGAAALAGIRLYDQASRGGGRTHRMVMALSERSMVVVATEKDRRNIESLIKRVRPELTDVRFMVVEPQPRSIQAVMAHGRPVTFDHEWIRHFFEGRLKDTQVLLEELGAVEWAPELPPDTVVPVSRNWR